MKQWLPMVIFLLAACDTAHAPSAVEPAVAEGIRGTDVVVQMQTPNGPLLATATTASFDRGMRSVEMAGNVEVTSGEHGARIQCDALTITEKGRAIQCRGGVRASLQIPREGTLP